MDMLHDQILKALLDTGLTQDELATLLGTSQPQIARWLKNQEPKYQAMVAIIDLAKSKGLVSDDYEVSTAISSRRNSNEIPEILLTGGLGGGGLSTYENNAENGTSFSKEVIKDYWRLPTWIITKLNVNSNQIAAFPVRGDSMEPTIENGDVIFIDTRHKVPSPPGIYAIADEFGGIVVKRIEVISKPSDEFVMVRISSDNIKHKDRELTLSEIQIVGRYVGRFTS